MSARRAAGTVAIIGGGASGVILAGHLLRRADAEMRVVLIEKRDRYGEGLAYSTPLDDHLLNVRAQGMSALADQPDHFVDWLRARPEKSFSGEDYVPRRLYAEYLRTLLATLEQETGASRLILLNAEARDIRPHDAGVEIRLDNGSSLAAHFAVLATGHEDNPRPEHPLAMKPGSKQDGGAELPADASVLILGTGLSMVDAWLALRAKGHRGPVTALSRRGLLPQPHSAGRPLRFDSADIPLGTDLSYFIAWFKDRLVEARADGRGWRDVVDGLRPYNQRIWQSWPVSAKKRFLEHTKPWWDIHRHRLAPAIHAQLQAAIDRKELSLLAGRLKSFDESADGRIKVAVRRRQCRSDEVLSVDRVYDCSGIVRDISQSSNPVLSALVDKGQARPDPLKLGVDVKTNCALVSATGRASERLFAIGPLTRGTFFEIEAVPEIRAQCSKLAAHFAGLVAGERAA
jgi:uncharacterized NAD(P)/FAD-binding protein YdhS